MLVAHMLQYYTQCEWDSAAKWDLQVYSVLKPGVCFSEISLGCVEAEVCCIQYT